MLVRGWLCTWWVVQWCLWHECHNSIFLSLIQWQSAAMNALADAIEDNLSNAVSLWSFVIVIYSMFYQLNLSTATQTIKYCHGVDQQRTVAAITRTVVPLSPWRNGQHHLLQLRILSCRAVQAASVRSSTSLHIVDHTWLPLLWMKESSRWSHRWKWCGNE